MSDNQTRNKIRNVHDLMNEIARIETLKEEQEAYLGNQYHLLREKIDKPIRFINSMVSSIPGVGMVKGVLSAVKNKGGKNDKSDWLTKALQLATPLVLNRTFLRNSGWLKKAAVLLASETAVSNINQNRITTAFSKVADFIRPSKRKSKKNKAPGEITAEESVESNAYGIPKDSETY